MKCSVRILVSLFAITLLSSVPGIFCGALQAQRGLTSSGTDYWLGFMPNGPPPGVSSVHQQLFIATGVDNKVTVNIGGAGGRTFSLTAGQVYDYDISGIMTSASEVATTNAIHITSVNPITVYGYSAWGNTQGIGDSPDGFLALPTTALGTKYYTMNFPDNYVFGQCPGEFLITSPYDDNDVTILPAADTKTGNHPQGVAWSVTLSKGQTYLVQSPGNNFGANDLTGSLITSTKPISVLTGHEISSVPNDYGSSADNMFEMIPSLDRWGTQYFDEPMAGKIIVGDYIRVLSGEDGNQITYTGDKSGPHGPLILNAGEFNDITLQTESMVFTSTNHKKFIVAQYSYSQGYNGDPGQSDPWMVLFTPQEQFEKEMIFRTPSSLKGAFTNYLTIVSLNDSLRKIMINGLPLSAYPFVGRGVFPGTNPLMGAWRITLGGGSRSFIVTSSQPFGAYQYGFSNYEGYGWPTGMAQGIISPDTLPPLAQIIDSLCGTFDLRFFEPRLKPAFSFNDTRISSISMITAAGDPRWPTPSFNYIFTPDPGFQIGDSVTNATITVVDPSKDAYAAIFAVDRAGNDSVYQYHYYAPKITFQPVGPYDFGAVLVDGGSCRTITVTNVQLAGDFLADSTHIFGSAKGGTFTVTPGTLGPLHAGSSITLKVCYHPSDTGTVSIDTLYLISKCVPYAMPVTGIGITPLIYANDLAFGEVDSGRTSCKPLTLRNPGKAPLTITQQDLVSDPNFSVNPSQIFPIVIPPGGQVTVSYCFHPQSWGAFQRRVTFLNQNPSQFQHSIKDTSLLTGIATPAGAKLTSYTKVFDVSCQDTVLFDTLYNNLGKPQSIDSVALIGSDASYLTLVNPPSFPLVLLPESGNTIPFQIRYNPLKNGFDLTPRTATLQVYASSLKGAVAPALVIQAQLVAPLAQFSAGTLKLGMTRVGQTATATFTITNAGNAPLVIPSYNLTGPDAASFTLSPAAPITIAPGGTQVITVTITGSEARTYTANVGVSAECNMQNKDITAGYSSAGDQVQGTTHPKTYLGGCRSNTQGAWYYNGFSNDSVTITGVSITSANGWTNTLDFSFGTTFQPVTLAPKGSDTIPIVFIPTATGSRSAALIFSLKGKSAEGLDSFWTKTVQLQGGGVAVDRQVAIGNITGSQVYHSTAGSGVDVPVVVSTPIDANAPDNGTLEAYGYRFDISWKRDAFNYVSISPPGARILTTAYNKLTDMETRTVQFMSNTPLLGVSTLATLSLESMLTKSDTTNIQLSNMRWLQSDSVALCYVTDTTMNGAHILDPVCGNTTLQNSLVNGAIRIDGIRPNPAGASATIDFSSAVARPITIAIYDVMGNEVKRLTDNQPMTAGPHSILFTSEGMGSGIYYCRVIGGRRVATQQFEIKK